MERNGPSPSAGWVPMTAATTNRPRLDEAISESEILVQVLGDNLPEGLVYQIDSGPDGQSRRFTYLSAGMEKMHGISRAEALADASRIYDQVIPEDRPLIARREADAAAHGLPFSAEVRVRLPSGEIRWRHFRSAPRWTQDGRLFWDGVEIDVTDRKRAQQMAIETGQNLSSLLDNLPGFIYRCDNDPQWTMRYISPGCRKLTGWAPEDFIGSRTLNYKDIVHPDYRQQLRQKWQELLARGKMFEFEYPIIDRRDAIRWVWERGRGVFLPDGSLLCLEGLVIETTARRQAEERLKASEEKLRRSEKLFREAFQYSPIGMVVSAPDGRFIQVNASLCSLLGYSEAELIGRTFLDITHPEDIGPSGQMSARVLAGEAESFTLEKRYLRKDGQVILGTVTGATVRDEAGRPLHYIIQIVDITARRQLEEERLKSQRLESIGVLAGGIAHEFNNILTGILGNISLAKMETEAGQNPTESLAATEQASLRARDLTRQLLTFSRGGQPLVRLCSVCELVEKELASLPHGSNVRCDLAVSPDLRPARIDPGQISQVIHNLVINAIQSMPDGGNVIVSAENADLPEYNPLGLAGGAYVVISVADRGPGIPLEMLTKIFDPYFTTKGKGSGLGLATCYSIVNRHQGRITVDSELGQGSVFRVYLPASADQLPVETAAAKPVGRGEGRILLMDDEEMVRRTARRMLNQLGYEVEEADEGARAVEMYRGARAEGRPYRAVIFDLTVPGGMGGKDAVAEIRRFDPGVKALVASGYSDDPVMADCRAYGFSGMVAKPFRLDELGTALQAVIGET